MALAAAPVASSYMSPSLHLCFFCSASTADCLSFHESVFPSQAYICSQPVGARRGERGYCKTFSPRIANVSKRTAKPTNPPAPTGDHPASGCNLYLHPRPPHQKGDMSTFHRHECCPWSLSVDRPQRVATTEAPGARHSICLSLQGCTHEAGGHGAPLGCIPVPGPQVTAQRVSLCLSSWVPFRYKLTTTIACLPVCLLASLIHFLS